MGNGTSTLPMGIGASYIVTCKLGAELPFVVILNIHPLFCLYNPHVWGNLGSKTQRLCSSEVLTCRQGFLGVRFDGAFVSSLYGCHLRSAFRKKGMMSQ
jgi:hypothetical protein